MNFLAHLVLTPPGEDYTMMGNLLGDFLKPKDFEKLDIRYQKGFELHLRIDQYTDHHPRVKAMIGLLKPSQGRYATVVVDIMMDYFLARHWSRFVNEEFLSFEQRVYQAMEEHLPEIIPNFDKSHVLYRMMKGRFLSQYHTLEGLSFVFTKLKPRLNFDNQIEHAIEDIRRLDSQIDVDFLQFFKEIKDYLGPTI